jgi:hypothetical protein
MKRVPMNFLKRCRGIQITLFATTAVFVLLASVTGWSKGVLGKKPVVVLQASRTTITFPCGPSAYSISRSCPTTFDLQVPLTSLAIGFNKRARYTYSVDGGRIVGDGSKVIWDLSGSGPGFYQATVEVEDSRKRRAEASVRVTLATCGDCINIEPCPTLVVSCYDQVKAGTVAVCKVVMGPLSKFVPQVFTYEWSVNASGGEDLLGRITSHGPSISIPTNGLAGQTVYVKVNVKGLDPSCGGTASGSTVVKPQGSRDRGTPRSLGWLLPN